MSRQEEFHDMPDLGPASDELDSPEIPTLKPMAEATKPAKPAGRGRSGQGLIYTLIVLLIGGLGAVSFLGWQQNQQLASRLQAAEAALASSDSRLTDIESLVSATDESVNKSGAALQAQLKQQLANSKQRVEHVDSEIAKLWAIYQKYRPTIETLEKQQKAQAEQLSAHDSELSTLGQSLDTVGLNLDKQARGLDQAQASLKKADTELARLASMLKQAQQKQQEMAAQLREQIRLQDLANQEVDDLQATQLSELQQGLESLRNNPQLLSGMKKQLQEHQQALASINSYRRQVNAQLLQLGERVKQLQQAPQR